MMASRYNLVTSRPWRFATLTVAVALIFSAARLLTLALLVLFLIVAAVGAYRRNSFFMAALIILCGLGISFHIFSMVDASRARDYMTAHTPPDPVSAKDGTHRGVGQGPRGPTEVFVSVQSGTIRDITLGSYLDAVSIDREAIDSVSDVILAGNSLDLNPDLIDRTPAVRGFYDAVSNALRTADPGFPGVSRFTRAAYFFTSHNFSRFAFNAIAIVFIVFLMFDYSLQSVLRKDTGQSLVCYNCQTCVGACPVKMVEGVPYPMTMVLETRLGNYQRVAELARYCVGCGRCTGKCPAGISAPELAAAAVGHVHREKIALVTARNSTEAAARG